MFIFFCRLRLLVCRSYDLRRFRSRDAFHVPHSTFAVCNDDCSLFLSANIMDYFARISYRFRYTERHLFHFVGITLINTSCEKNIKYLSFAWISIENGRCSLRMVSYTNLANITCGTQPLRKSHLFFFFFFIEKITNDNSCSKVHQIYDSCV